MWQRCQIVEERRVKMDVLMLTEEVIDRVKSEAANLIRQYMKADLIKVILYGSCARGDYTSDSDIDIALLTKCDRLDVKKYDEKIAQTAAELAMKYFAVVNFVCLPYAEFMEKKSWYPYFQKIEEEGMVLYG